MIKTTSQYTKLMNEIIRAPTEADVELHLVDPEITEQASMNITGSVETYSTDLTTPAVADYITLEHDWFKVDGSQYILPINSQDVLPNGVVGVLGAVIQIYYIFTTPVNFRGISLHFEDVSPTQSDYIEFNLKCYKNHVVVHEFNFNIFHDWEIFDRNVTQDVDMVAIKVSQLNSMGDYSLRRRLRVKEIILGQVLQIKPEKLISVRHDIKRSYLSTELYSNQVDLVMYDEDKTFNPDNPDGLWDLLRENETLKIYYSIEDNRFLRNTLYLSDKKSLNDARLQLTAVSPLQLLNSKYYEVWMPPYSWSELEEHLMSGSDHRLSIDITQIESLNNPLPPLPVNQCLQLIANATCSHLFVDEHGVIIISDVISDDITCDISFSEMFEKPILDIKSQVKNVIVPVTTYGDISEADSEISFDSGWIVITDRYVIDVTSDDYSLMVAILSVEQGSTVQIDSTHTVMTFYKGHIELIGTGTCKLQIKKETFPKNVEYITYPVNDEGEDCTIDNPLISDKTMAYRVAEWVANYYQNTKVYETSVRQNYALETGDVVNFKNNMNDTIPALVERLQFNTPGQTGAIEVRRWDNGLDNT